MNNDTIVAISTSIGEAAIGIVRISGEKSIAIADKIFVSSKNKKLNKFLNRQLVYGHIYDGKHIIDEVLVSYMKKPNTYTKENIVEINCHGGIVPLNQILKLVIKNGARLAEKGEFTKRAFLNGRLDLVQAEAVMDLISAKTPKGFDIAYNQLDGKLSNQIKKLIDELLIIMANIEVGIDYPEEDIEEITYNEILEHLKNIKKEIEKLLKNSQTGRVLREGLKTVIVGKPNVGKSSLMNALLREARSIVTDIPGTTRDIIEEYINIKGIPLRIVDTAGIRDVDNVIEKMGVQLSKEQFNKADLIILVLNAAESITKDDIEIMKLVKKRNAIIIINKTDLPQIIDMEIINNLVKGKPIIRASIALEHGLDELEDKIEEIVYGGKIKSIDVSPIISNLRHINALEIANNNINDAIRATKNKIPYDFIEVDIKNVYEALGEISGDTIEEDVLSKIFSRFCIGK